MKKGTYLFLAMALAIVLTAGMGCENIQSEAVGISTNAGALDFELNFDSPKNKKNGEKEIFTPEEKREIFEWRKSRTEKIIFFWENQTNSEVSLEFEFFIPGGINRMEAPAGYYKITCLAMDYENQVMFSGDLFALIEKDTKKQMVVNLRPVNYLKVTCVSSFFHKNMENEREYTIDIIQAGLLFSKASENVLIQDNVAFWEMYIYSPYDTEIFSADFGEINHLYFFGPEQIMSYIRLGVADLIHIPIGEMELEINFTEA